MDAASSQRKRDALSFVLTLSLYLLAILLWKYYLSTVIVLPPAEKSTEISLDLNEFVKEPTLPEIPDVKEEIIEEKQNEELSEEPEKLQDPVEESVAALPEPIPIPTPEPVVEKKEPLPPSKPIKHRKRKSVKKKQQARKKSKIDRKKGRNKTKSSSGGSSYFLARLKAKIDANKVYPRIARKRGMQGKVKVHFKVTVSGKLANLSVSGPRVFVNSAKSAVRKSFPVSTSGASLPVNVSLVLNYRLKS